MNAKTCPKTDAIDRYLAGSLPPGEATELEQHLDACNVCEETFRGAVNDNGDTLHEAIREFERNQAPDVPPVEIDTADSQEKMAGLIQRIQSERFTNLPDDESTTLAEDRAAEVLRLLSPSEVDGSLGRLGHYDLHDLLGSGSTGVVFAAIDQRLNREVAIKILRPSLGAAARKRFLREARAAAQMDHENVITIFDVGEVSGLAYLTMQSLPGLPLEDRLAEVTFLAEDEVRSISRQICEALEQAHRQNIVHRDIKPANIWIDTSRNQIKLLDFGLARVADMNSQLTATGVLAGTPNYMSPEQTRGQELDGRSDLFSLGCLMYRCVTGRLPFGAGGVLATLQAIQHDQPTPPEQLNPAISSDLSDLILTLLEKQPDNRPESTGM
ncbi:MAG: protein kinase [Pirellulaceae bacterium]